MCCLHLPVADAGSGGVILVVGDSLSAAYGISKQDAWPNLLQQKLHRLGYKYRVVNASISGDTTAGGLARLPKSVKREQPDVVIIELGANDGLRGLSLVKAMDNLEKMIQHSQQADARVLLLGMRLPHNYGADYGEKFHQIYLDVAYKSAIPLVAFFLQGVAETRAMMLADGLHPNADAQPMILENVWQGLVPLLD